MKSTGKNLEKVDNDHYDVALVMNDSDDNIDSKEKKENIGKINKASEGEIMPAKTNVQAPLPRFNFGEIEKLASSSNDYKSLLTLMNRFEPTEIQLDTKLKPFIPSYIPSIGEVDAFLKVHRPDKAPEEFGLSVIDEPTIEGVDPDTFILKLIYNKKNPGFVNHTISSISNAEKNPKQIQNWIDKIAEISNLSSTVPYSKNMPEIESLMQLWPEKMEQAINEVKLPDEGINLPTEIYAKIICNLLDIPVHKVNSNKGITEALHVLFSLYSVVKENQAYKNIEKTDNVQSIKLN